MSSLRGFDKPTSPRRASPRRYRNPWGVPIAIAKRYGYPLPAMTPAELELEQRQAAMDDALEAVRALREALQLVEGER